MDSVPNLMFVYGTLMRGYDHPLARHLAENADWRGPATCRGRLYRIGTYPGLVLSADASDIVRGDLYALHDAESLLAILDDYEGCGRSDPEPHPYVRTAIDVTTGDETVAAVWTYVYRLPVTGLAQIADGRFFR